MTTVYNGDWLTQDPAYNYDTNFYIEGLVAVLDIPADYAARWFEELKAEYVEAGGSCR